MGGLDVSGIIARMCVHVSKQKSMARSKGVAEASQTSATTELHAIQVIGLSH
jgi:hypothetical protein